MITNLGELKSTLTRYLKRSDLADLYPDWIDFASSRLDNDMRLPQQEFRTTATANAQFLQLPLDFIEMRNIQINYEGALPLQYVTPEQIDHYSRVYKSQPIQFYTIMNNQIELIPAPASNSTTVIELFYYAKQVALASDTDTNAILVAFPQLYVYATLMEAMPFLEYGDAMQAWDKMYMDMAKLLNDRAQAGRYSGNSLRMRAI